MAEYKQPKDNVRVRSYEVLTDAVLSPLILRSGLGQRGRYSDSLRTGRSVDRIP